MPAIEVEYVELPEDNNVPAVAASYQSIVLPLGGVALIVPGAALVHMVTVPPLVGAAGFGLIFNITAVRVVLKQPVVRSRDSA